MALHTPELLAEARRVADATFAGVYLVRRAHETPRYAHFDVLIHGPGNVRVLTYDSNASVWIIRGEDGRIDVVG